MGKNRRGLPASRFNRVNPGPIRFPSALSGRIMTQIALQHAHGRSRELATSQNRRLQPDEARPTMFRQGGAASRQIPFRSKSCFDPNLASINGSSDGPAMKGDQGKGAEKTGTDVKDSRRDRLKLALRENLKRRKSQARGRSDVDAAPSENADVSLDDASGAKPGQ